MRFVQLRAFHHVAICGGFSRAAEKLFLTQPAISDQVRKLEEEYDVVLFNRQRKQVTLTAAGEQLLAITRRLFDVEQQARDLLTESRALRSGTLRIVADSAYHLIDVFAAFRKKYPNITFRVDAGNTETVMRSLYSYEADVGVLGEIPTGRDFEVVQLNSTPILAFAATGHPAAREAEITLADLACLPLILRERGSKTRRKLEEAARAAGITLTPVIEAEGREAVREIVASGACVGIVSAAEFGQDTRLRAIPIAGPPMLMDEALICLRDRSQGKLVRAFLDCAIASSI